MRERFEQYEITFMVRRHIVDDEEREPIIGIHGSITTPARHDDDRDDEVGSITAYRLSGDHASEAIIDSADSIDGDVYRCAEIAFGGASTEAEPWNDALVEAFHHPTHGSDLLYCHSMTIDRAHRGSGLGLAAMNRLIETFEAGCGYVACFPQSLEGEKSAAARKKLGAYWKRLGFEPFARTGFLFLNMDYRRPSLEEALRDNSPKKLPGAQGEVASSRRGPGKTR